MEQENTKTHEQWEKGFEEFKAKYPDMPEVKHIETLDLLMRREYAEDILAGRKRVEFRDASQYYDKKLVDMPMFEYIDKKINEEDKDFLEIHQEYVSAVRLVDKIHFHNYNNSWYLDVEVQFNELITADDEGVEFMQKEFNCHELDKENEWAKTENKKFPSYYYFVLGDVIDTNLEK